MGLDAARLGVGAGRRRCLCIPLRVVVVAWRLRLVVRVGMGLRGGLARLLWGVGGLMWRLELLLKLILLGLAPRLVVGVAVIASSLLLLL